MTETPQKGVLSGRPHVLNPAWQLPSAELASSSQAGLTPQIGKGCVDHVWSTMPLREDYVMGKTLSPFSQLIEYERRRWVPFKKALPKADQVLFDRLFDCAKMHIQAGVMVARPWAFETIAMAVFLEQQKKLEQLQRLLEELQNHKQG
jgi:hypothetical protein